MKLYDLPILWSQLEMDLEDAGGEITPDLEARINSLLEGGAEKLDSCMKFVRTLEAQAEAAGTEAQRLMARQTSFTNRAARVKALILPALLALGGKVKTPLFTFSTQTRRNVAFELRPGAEIWTLDPRFVRVKPAELNLAELKKAEAAGEEIPESLAVVKSSSTSLVVR